MKKLFFCIALLNILAISICKAQTYNPNIYQLLGTKKTNIKFPGMISIDSIADFPKDTIAFSSAMRQIGFFSDKPYFFDGTTWNAFGVGGIPIDLFGLYGASHLQGYGSSSSLSETVSPNILFQYYSNVITNKTTDPIGNANTGSAWPSFAKTWYAQTGRKICFVPMGIPGSSMNASADVGNGNWDSTGVLFDTAVARTQRAVVALTAAGYTVNFRGIITDLGANDALAINATTITQANYITSFTKFKARIRSTFGRNTPIYISQIGKQVTGTDVGHAAVRAAQITLSKADSLVNIVFWNGRDFIARGYQTDQYHYTQTGYNEMGRILAEQILNSGGNKWQEQDGNLYYVRGNVGIGPNHSRPTYPFEVDSAKIAAFTFSNEGFGGQSSIRSPLYMTFKSGSDLFIFQSVGSRPAEIRFGQNDAGTSGSGTTPWDGVLNWFNFGTAARRGGLITTSGVVVAGVPVAGNILIKPCTNYATLDTTQYGSDSVWVQLNRPGAFYIDGGKLLANDSVQFTNIPAGGTTNDSIAVITSTGVVKRMDPARISGGGGGSYSAGYGLLLTSTTFSVDSFSIVTRARVQKGIDSLGALLAGAGANTALSNLSSVAINAALVLGTSDAFALGSTSKQWSDLFLAESGVINWDNGDATLTQSGNNLNLAGADFNVAGNINVTPTSDNQNTFQINNNAGNPAWLFGTYPGVPTYSGIWAQTGSPTGSNPIIITNGSQVIFNAPSDMSFRINNASSTPAISVNSGQQIGFSNSGPAVGTLVAFGEPGSIAGNWSASGIGSGTIKFNLQSAAGSYNWNWPITAGTAGQVLTSGGGGSTAMTWGNVTAAASIPTISNLVNVTGTPSSAVEHYLRVGDAVTVWGSLAVNPTSSATITTIDLTIPVASTFAVAGNASGNFTSQNGTSGAGAIIGLSSTVQFSFTPSSSGNRTIYYQYSYTVL